MTDSTQPVFVIGSYRSGTSILTWSLGQHPNLFSLEETNWIYKMAVNLKELYKLGTVNGDRSHLSATGISKSDFFEHFGDSINQLMMETKIGYLRKSVANLLENELGIDPDIARNGSLRDISPYLNIRNFSLMRSIYDPKLRWVDGTPENSHFVYGLSRLFPKAKFIHILRHPNKVAKSLMNFSAMNQKDYPEEEAYTTWMNLVESCYMAEKALGSEKVLRLYQDDLEQRPEAAIRQCIEFIGEVFHQDCLLPLNERINSSKVTHEEMEGKAVVNGEVEYKIRAIELYNELRELPFQYPNVLVLKELEKRFESYT